MRMKPYHAIVASIICMISVGQCQGSCLPNPCRNGATCFAGSTGGGYFCSCSDGYSGSNCQNYDVCYGGCYNSGTCTVNSTLPLGYECECPRNYEGDRCEVDVCAKLNPCENGGTCSLSSAVSYGYQCRCTTPFEGIHCQTMINDACSSLPCMNEGICYLAYTEDTPTNENFICVCKLGYTGGRCEIYETASDICDAMRPCVNGGTCFASSTNDLAFICMCVDGFTGVRCEQSNMPDLCLSYNPCENNSTCVHLSGASSVTCQCAPGYVGANCNRIDTGNGDCLPNPCKNGGTCSPDPFGSSGYRCTCPPAFSGTQCELEYFGCASNPCQSGGTCVVHTYGVLFCQCPEGYIGRLCENAGPCASSPCLNSGICMENPQAGGYNCRCQSGFMGTHCEQLSTGDPCTPNPCNGGTCFKSDSGGVIQFICQCPPQTVGILCNDDPCLSMPCMNGGSCEPIFNPVTGELVAVGCICPTGFTGPSCAVVGPCQSNPCQNGGTCIDSTGSSPDPLTDWDDHSSPIAAQLAFFCTCLTDWSGTTCSERRDDPCTTNTCLNDGTCIRMGERTYTCVCQEQYAGLRCESQVEPCSPNPCLNFGTCVATGAEEYSCVCTSQYVGTHCQRRDPCVPDPCLNGGTCYRSWQDEVVICMCAAGYNGQRCEQRIDPCLADPCLNGGTCFTGAGFDRFSCVCSSWYTGGNCEEMTDPCMSEPCKNGGQCLTGESSYQCVCSPGFMGEFCEQMINPCSSNPCQNGGQCFTGITSYWCVCTSGFTGDRCEDLIDPCLSNPCYNGGQCFTGTTGFWCLCSPDYGGVHCTERVTATSQPTTQPVIVKDACTPNPCFNDGTCLPIGSGLFSYTCLCPMHYAGLTCGVHLQRPASSTATPTTIPQTGTVSTTTTTGQTPTTGSNRGASSQEPLPVTERVSSTKSTTEIASTFETSTFEPRICFHDASVYKEGATRVNDCVQCTCINGEWLCGERNCDCMIDGVRYENTDRWTNDCNTCICNGGLEFCTQMNCGKACNHQGVYYVDGDSRRNDCNTCMCVEGNWMCTDNTCEDACLFGPDKFLEGERRKESCNSCFCLKDAQWLCTVRDCEGSPIIISVSFKINHEFAAIQNSQPDFIQVFKDDMRRRYNLSKQNIQNVMVFPGSILVMFDLVEVKDSNINVEAVASDLQFKVQGSNYTLSFQGLHLFPDPNSYVKEKLETGSPKSPNSSKTIFDNLGHETIILIAVIGCGILGLIVVVSSVCYFTRRAPRRARTEYGESRLPRASDYDDGFVNSGYEEGLSGSQNNTTDDSLPRNHRVIHRN